MLTTKPPKPPAIGNNDKKKRKHLSLSVVQKVELLQRLECGVSVRCISEEYSVRTTTIYDLRNRKTSC